MENGKRRKRRQLTPEEKWEGVPGGELAGALAGRALPESGAST